MATPHYPTRPGCSITDLAYNAPVMEQSIAPERTNPWIGPWEGGWPLIPLAAVIGGAWTVVRPLGAEALPRLAIAIALVLLSWAPLWRALTATHWAGPLRRWRDWDTRALLPQLPFVQPNTPGEALSHALEQACAWWQVEGSATLAAPLGSALLALIASPLLCLPLGRTALLLTLIHFAWAQLMALWSEGSGQPGVFGEAVAIAGLPWLLGTTMGEGPLSPGGSLAVVALLSFYAVPGLPALLGPLLAAGYLLWQGEALATGALLLLALPGLYLLTQRLPAAQYRRTIAIWIIAMLLLMGWVL